MIAKIMETVIAIFLFSFKPGTALVPIYNKANTKIPIKILIKETKSFSLGLQPGLLELHKNPKEPTFNIVSQTPVSGPGAGAQEITNRESNNKLTTPTFVHLIRKSNFLTLLNFSVQANRCSRGVRRGRGCPYGMPSRMRTG